MAELDFTNIAPGSISTPAGGVLAVFANNATKRLNYKDDAGNTGAVGVPYATYYLDDYGITPANTAATNVTNLNTLLQTTAPAGSKIQWGAGTYQFNAGLTALTKDFAFVGVRGQTTIAITAAMGSAVNFINLSNTGFYSSFRDLNFVNFATQTNNYVIEGNNNANVEILDCFFTGAANWAGVLDFTGTNSGNGAILKNVYISQFAGTAINVSSPFSLLFIEDLEIIGGGVATSIGLNYSNGGASCINNSQIMGCNICLSLNAVTGATVSAVYVTNSFFDQGKTNALLITGAGTGTVARCKFTNCWFTSASNGTSPNCVQISTSGTAIHAGITFTNCMIGNATPGSSGTLVGINATSVADLTLVGCQISAWTQGISITPASAGTCILNFQGNQFGNYGLLTGNTTGIILNAGSFVYGTINIQNNTFVGNTTNITDNSLFGAGTAALYPKSIQDNTGSIIAAWLANYTATTIPLTTVTCVDSHGGILIPAGFRAGTIRVSVLATNSATLQTLTATVRYGTNNTNADAAVLTQAFTAGTAAVGSGEFVFDVTINTSTTLGAFMRFFNGNNAATGIAGNISLFAGISTLATISTAANNWLGVYFSSATAAAITIRSVTYEVLSQ